MSRSPLRFTLNQPHVITEDVDNEVVAINLDTGCYYNMEKSAAIVWRLLCDGATFDEIMHAMTQRYYGERTAIESSIQQFLQELQVAQLVVPAADGETTLLEAPLRPPAPAAKIAFEPPVLCEYTDMQDLLLLDPIHDVTNQGWPVRQL